MNPTAFFRAVSLGLVGSLVAASFAAETLVADKHDLAPKFEKGQELKVTTKFNLGLVLDDAEMKFGDFEINQTPTVDMQIEGNEVLTEKVEKADAGKVTSLVRTYDEGTMQVTGQAGMAGETEEIDEEQETPLVGRRVRVMLNEQGEKVVEDLTNEGREEDEHLDEIEEGMRAVIDLDSHFEMLLPKTPQEVGGKWDVGQAVIAKVAQMIAQAAAEDDEMAKGREAFDKIMQKAELRAEGELLGVDGDVANIKYTMTATLNIDDFAEMIRSIADEEDIEDMPEDMVGNIKLKIEMEGNGRFNLKAHQLTSFEMAGEFGLEVRMSMSQQGMEFNMGGSLSGDLGLSGGVEIL